MLCLKVSFGIQLITNVKNKMKFFMSIADLIETVNDELKNITQIEHSRRHSFNNFIVNALSAMAVYCFFEKKLAIEVGYISDGQLIMF